MKLPLNITELMSSSSKLREEREKPVRIAVLVDAEAPQPAVDALKAAMLPQTGNALLRVEALVPGDVLEIDSAADVVIGLAGPGATLEPTMRVTRNKAIPTVLLGWEEDKHALATRLSQPLLDTIAEEEADDLIRELGEWLSERVAGKRVALAANFPFVRRAVAVEAVKNTAFQNGVIGAVAVLPGADMPLMTANQAKMVLQVAAAYGEPLGAERIKELATVVGGAFVFRTVARQFVGLVPGFGWAIKAGIGYSATIAMGYAAIEYFEAGGDPKELAEKLREARDQAIERARAGRGAGEADEVIPAHGWVVEDEPTPGSPALVSADDTADSGSAEPSPL